MPMIMHSAAARIKRLRAKAARIAATLDAELPAYVAHADDHGINDGGGYGDVPDDPRPDFVKADDAAWRRRKFED